MTAIKFNIHYDVQRLADELAKVFDHQWIDHYNTKDFKGQWKSISLRSASGQSTDIFAHYNDQPFVDTPLLEELPYIQSILRDWKCDKEAVRFMALYPGSEIKAHRDLGCSYHDGNFRLHIPILTNDQISFYVNGENHQLIAGSCWYMDFSTTHAVQNNGQTVRVHLVIDCVRNAWTDKIFEENGYVAKMDGQSIEEVKKIIQELQTHKNAAAETLINQLKAKHGI